MTFYVENTVLYNFVHMKTNLSQSFGPWGLCLAQLAASGGGDTSPFPPARDTHEDKFGTVGCNTKVRQQILSNHHLTTLSFQDKLREEAGGAWDPPFHWQSLLNSISWDSQEPGYPGDRDEPDTSEHSSGNHTFCSQLCFLSNNATLKICNLESWKQQLRWIQTPVNFWHAFISQKL